MCRFITLKKNMIKNKNLIYTVSYLTAVIFSAISLVSHNRSLFALVHPESSAVFEGSTQKGSPAGRTLWEVIREPPKCLTSLVQRFIALPLEF